VQPDTPAARRVHARSPSTHAPASPTNTHARSYTLIRQAPQRLPTRPHWPPHHASVRAARRSVRVPSLRGAAALARAAMRARRSALPRVTLGLGRGVRANPPPNPSLTPAPAPTPEPNPNPNPSPQPQPQPFAPRQPQPFAPRQPQPLLHSGKFAIGGAFALLFVYTSEM